MLGNQTLMRVQNVVRQPQKPGNHVKYETGLALSGYAPRFRLCPAAVSSWYSPCGFVLRRPALSVAIPGIRPAPFALGCVAGPAEACPDRSAPAADGKAPTRSPDTARTTKGGVHIRIRIGGPQTDPCDSAPF